jgi:addiction module RelB/DinJ family antitoxin
MNTATIFIKTEPRVKKEAQRTAAELGFSLSSIINAFLRQLVKTKTIHFSAKELDLDEIPNEYFKKELKQALKDREEGKASPILKSADEAIKWLEQQGI